LVAQAVIDHSEALEADLFEHFGIDLGGFWTRKLSLRRLLVLIRRLLRMHGRSALSEALIGEQAAWSNIEYILADLRDSIEVGNYLFLSAHKSEGYRMPDFQPYPRPGLDLSQRFEEPEPEWATAQDLMNFFSQVNRG